MDDCCEWTDIKLVHEIIADLQSLQGAWVEWMTLGEPGEMQAIIRVLFQYPEEKVFRLRLVLARNEDSAEFDRVFDG